VRGLPTLIVVNGDGEAALIQVGLIKPGEVQAKVDELITAVGR
jgi:hypothetical protein